MDTSINYEKVILYTCGEEIEILKGDSTYEVGNCKIIDSIKVKGKDSLRCKSNIRIFDNYYSSLLFITKDKCIGRTFDLITSLQNYTIKYYVDDKEYFVFCAPDNSRTLIATKYFNSDINDVLSSNLYLKNKTKFNLLPGTPAQFEYQQK